jgi:uncharacterized protein
MTSTASTALTRPPPAGRAGELVRLLELSPHPEGGWYREVHRSPHTVDPRDGRPERASLTTIDFLLAAGEFSAWHRVRSDEVWHLLEGGPLRLWIMSPGGDVTALRLAPCGTAMPGREPSPVAAGGAPSLETPRAVVPAGWWQAAEPLGDFAYVGATVAPGFDFADFDFLRDDAAQMQQLRARTIEGVRLL